jgi:y4mF family transcriptional regulator
MKISKNRKATPVNVQPLTLEQLQRQALIPFRNLAARPPAVRSLRDVATAGPSYHPVATAADLGTLVRTARETMGMTQQQFSDLAGVGRRFLSELENGKQTSEIGLVLQVCRSAGIDVFAKRRRR